MTYCLALRLVDGLVFLADTRTDAGVDNVGTYRKLDVLRPRPSASRGRGARRPVAGTKITLGSMMSTARADLSVVPPYDLAIVRADGGVALQEFRGDRGLPVLARLREVWKRHRMSAIAELPPITAGDFESVTSTD